MADAFTNLAASNLDQAAYNLFVDTALRSDLIFDQLADVRASNQAMPGTTVTFTIADDMAIASTALNESVDVDAVALSDSQVTLTLTEHGNAAIYTQKLAGTSFVPFDPIAAERITRNASESLDELCSIALRGGSNVAYATGGTTDPTARNKVEPADTITAYDCRKARAKLRSAKADTFDGGQFVGIIHPDVVMDLQGDSGADGWLQPANYSEPERRWNGELGRFDGVRYIETPRAPVFADAGSSTTLTDVYATLILGRRALAKGYSVSGGWSELPQFVKGVRVDKLQRLQPLGWKWFGAYGRYFEACIRRIESASSIGANS